MNKTQYDQHMLIISRAGHYHDVLKNCTYIQNLDGPYIDKICLNFKSSSVLSLPSKREVSIINYKPENKNIIPFPTRSTKFKKFFEYLGLYKYVIDSDVVYVFLPMPASFFAAVYATILKKKLICYSGAIWEDMCSAEKSIIKRSILKFFYKKMENFVVKKSDIRIFNNNTLFEQYSYLRLTEKTKPITNIREHIENTLSNNLQSHDEINFKNKEFNIISVGNIIRYKGQCHVIKALPTLIKNGINIKYHIVGEVGDQGYYSELQNLITEFSLEDKVVFEGYKEQEEVISLMRGMDCFILASDREGFPRVIWEAMLMSIPVIATDIQNIVKELGEDTNRILYLREDRTKDIIDNIMLLINNIEIRNLLVETSTRYVEKIFNEEPSDQVIRMYNELLTQKR